MATITQHAQGTFCWPELVTTDRQGAKAFYTGLFGWNSSDNDLGEGGTYTMLRKGERDTGALYQMNQEQRARNVPPHWGSYVAVDSADAAAEKAVQLGGKQIQAPFDVMDVGRMAVFQDPQGATFAVWQAKKHIGAGVLDEPGALCWTELMTSDPAAARRFYSGLFGWTTEDMPIGPMTYTMFKNGPKSAGGMMAITPEMGPIPPHWLVYFAVQDSDASVARAILLGASVTVPPTDIPGMGRFAVMQDPQGARFAIFAQAKKA